MRESYIYMRESSMHSYAWESECLNFVQTNVSLWFTASNSNIPRKRLIFFFIFPSNKKNQQFQQQHCRSSSLTSTPYSTMHMLLSTCWRECVVCLAREYLVIYLHGVCSLSIPWQSSVRLPYLLVLHCTKHNCGEKIQYSRDIYKIRGS